MFHTSSSNIWFDVPPEKTWRKLVEH